MTRLALRRRRGAAVARARFTHVEASPAQLKIESIFEAALPHH